MLRSRDEIKTLARNLVNGVLAEMMAAFPGLSNAVNKLPTSEWLEFIDERTDEMETVLLNKFSSAD